MSNKNKEDGATATPNNIPAFIFNRMEFAGSLGDLGTLLPLSIDPALFARPEFIWGEEPWVTVHRTLLEPAMNLALAAPVTPFAEPFQEAAKRNLWILIIVALAGFFLAAS